MFEDKQELPRIVLRLVYHGRSITHTGCLLLNPVGSFYFWRIHSSSFVSSTVLGRLREGSYLIQTTESRLTSPLSLRFLLSLPLGPHSESYISPRDSGSRPCTTNGHLGSDGREGSFVGHTDRDGWIQSNRRKAGRTSEVVVFRRSWMVNVLGFFSSFSIVEVSPKTKESYYEEIFRLILLR